MIKKIWKSCLLLCINLLPYNPCHAQENNKEKIPLRLGLNYGVGTEDVFPYNSKDYSYDIQFYKIQILYHLKEKKNWLLEINIEPSLYLTEHILLNEYYIQPRHGLDYLEQRTEMVKKKQINEYVLGLGILLSHKTLNKLNTYILGSVGPMVNNKGTERLAKGFAFSDVLALGLSYKIENINVDLRGSLRHVSNLKIQKPNSGYNSVNLEIGCTFSL